jgi:hypothetical protein
MVNPYFCVRTNSFVTFKILTPEEEPSSESGVPQDFHTPLRWANSASRSINCAHLITFSSINLKELVQQRVIMGIKARFMHRKSAAMPVEVQSIEDFGPSIEAKLHKRTDEDTASIASSNSDISPIAIDIVKEEEAQGIVDVSNSGFFSTLCCHGGSLPGDDDADDLKEKEETPQEHVETGEDEGFFSKITGTFLYMLGQAPPVQIVKCLEDRSVDQSEVSLPQVLTDMAEEYDQTQLKLQIQDHMLKSEYEKQQKESRRKKMKLPLIGSSAKSTSATVSSNSSLFERLKKKKSSRSKRDNSPLYEV